MLGLQYSSTLATSCSVLPSSLKSRYCTFEQSLLSFILIHESRHKLFLADFHQVIMETNISVSVLATHRSVGSLVEGAEVDAGAELSNSYTFVFLIKISLFIQILLSTHSGLHFCFIPLILVILNLFAVMS